MRLKPVLDAFARTPAALDLAERLPARGETLRLGGLPGSSGAVLAAWLAARFPQRLLTIVAPTPGDAERWLTDLAHLTDEGDRAVPAARGAGRGRAALRDRRRAGGDDRGAAAGPAPACW